MNKKEFILTILVNRLSKPDFIIPGDFVTFCSLYYDKVEKLINSKKVILADAIVYMTNNPLKKMICDKNCLWWFENGKGFFAQEIDGTISQHSNLDYLYTYKIFTITE